MFRAAHEHLGLLAPLENNYRSRPHILDYAMYLLRGASEGVLLPKVLRPTKQPTAEPVHYWDAGRCRRRTVGQ